jgi:hypothetical protein
MLRSLLVSVIGLLLAGLPSGAAAQTAQDILAKSIQAHGGDRLTTWKTMVVDGTIVVQDGVTYQAAYRLYAKTPGRLRVEHDLTADRGRRFDQYFLNGGASWMRRNLVVGNVPLARVQRWLDQCSGVAAYAKHSAAFSLQPDAVVRPAPRLLGIHQRRRPRGRDEDQRVRQGPPGRNADADHVEEREVRRARGRLAVRGRQARQVKAP